MKRSATRFVLSATAAIAVIAALCYSSAVVYSQSDSDLLTLVSAGTQNATNSLRSGTGRIVHHAWRTTTSGGTSETETVYAVAFSGERFKLSAVKTVIQNSPGPNESGKTLVPAGTIQHYSVAYDGNKLTVFYPDDKAVNVLAYDRSKSAQPSYWREISPLSCGFHPVIALPSNGKAKRQSADGAEYVVVDVEQTDKTPGNNNFTSKRSFWVDVQKGFVVARMVVHGHNDIYKEDALLDETTTTVRDYGSGLWGPNTCTRVSYRANKSREMEKVRTDVITYDPSFLLDVPVSDSDLALALPSGTNVVDETLDMKYTLP